MRTPSRNPRSPMDENVHGTIKTHVRAWQPAAAKVLGGEQDRMVALVEEGDSVGADMENAAQSRDADIRSHGYGNPPISRTLGDPPHVRHLQPSLLPHAPIQQNE